MVEYMDIVDDDNKVIGKTTQEEIYAKKLNHRIVHIFVINPKTNQVYFQKRSEKKSFLPGYYCTSAGGHVQAGETYEDAAKRELREEIGLRVPIKKVYSMLFESGNHKRFIEMFVAFAEDGFNFADGEVASGKFISLEKAKELVEKDVKIHPQLSVCYKWFIENQNKVLND